MVMALLSRLMNGAAPIWVTDVGWFAQGPQLAARDTFGQLGPKGTTLKGVSMLYAFILDTAVTDNEGQYKIIELRPGTYSITVRVTDNGSAPLSAQDFLEFQERTGHTLVERYGMTETGITLSNSVRGERKPAS